MKLSSKIALLSKNPITRYIQESYEELQKVSWPTREQTIRHTTIVIIFSLTVGVFIGLFDFVLSKLFSIFL